MTFLAVQTPLNWSPETLNKVAQRMRQKLVGERMGPGTWDRTWAPYLKRLEEVAGERGWHGETSLIRSYLRQWQEGSAYWARLLIDIGASKALMATVVCQAGLCLKWLLRSAVGGHTVSGLRLRSLKPAC